MSRTRALGLVLAVALLAACAFLLPLPELLERLFEQAHGLGPWGALLVAALYLPAGVLCLPGLPITLTCAFGFGFATALPPIILFSNLGAQAAFLVGRTVVRGRVERRVRASPTLAAIDRAVGEEGLRIVLLLRLSPLVPFNLLNYALAASRLRFRDFAVGTFLGMLPLNVLYVYVGSALGTLSQALAGEAEIGGWGYALFALGLAATIVATVLVSRRARRSLADVLDGAQAP